MLTQMETKYMEMMELLYDAYSDGALSFEDLKCAIEKLNEEIK
jgi:hypothetical protein